jgi:hypothetical protein
MEPTNDLDRLALLHGSDKFGSHWYTGHYDRYFQHFRNDPINLLEIGVGGYDRPDQGGASLLMWRDYFPHARIYGLDWYPKTSITDDRISIYQGSQADPVAVSSIIADTPNRQFDIIIDDGSHRSEHVIATFMMLFQYVAEGGWYVVEDTQTSYWSNYGGTSATMSAPMTTIGFFKNLIDGLNWREIHNPGYEPNFTDMNISGLHFHHNLIFVRKGPNVDPSNIVVDNRVPAHL